MNHKEIEPSLLSFDVNNLQSQLLEVKQAGAKYIHYDVMDGIFVPNKSFGVEHLNVINQNGLLTNVHMMVIDPIKWINDFVKYPINSLTFHPEVIDDNSINQAFTILKQHQVKYGIALKFSIDANKYLHILKHCNYVCIMGVEPGKGGQTFNDECINNLKKVYEIKQKYNPSLIIQLDGGVNFEVIKKTYLWVDHFISGSFLMKLNNKKSVFDFVNNF